MPTDFRRIVRVLLDHDVDFLVVGALASVLQGAPISTFDIDIVHERSPENVERLQEALEALDARYRGPGNRDLTPDSEDLAGEGHHLLETDAGPLDVLGKIEQQCEYEDLIADSVELEFEGDTVRALSLERYVEFVADSDRAKDQGRLAVLRETLDQQKGD